MPGADEAGAMFAVLVNVEFVRDAVFAQRGGVKKRVLGGYQFVLLGVPEKDGGQARTGLQFAGGFPEEFLSRRFTE
jgi:hypothetical protein